MNKELRILYITYIDFEEASSGSSVRPKEMYKAFYESGHKLTLLYGKQPYKGKNKERNARIKEILINIRNDKPDLCYIESPTYPVFNIYDLYLLVKIRIAKIPTSYFYRDAYWKFGIWGSIKGMKRMVFRFLYSMNSVLIRYCCKIIYFPSESMTNYFNYKDMRPLPPAGNNNLADKLISIEPKDVLDCIYVGGASENYGLKTLLDAVCVLNIEYEKKLNLTVITRRDEADELLNIYEDKPFITYKTLSGSELFPEYNKSDFAVIPKKKNTYNDFAVNVKLFEYLSFGLPIVATNCFEVEKFITENDIGLITNDSKESMVETLRYLIDNKEALNKFAKNARTTLLDSNLWTHRVEQIIRDLRINNG